MGYQADSIANYFIDKSNEGLMFDLNPMKLQRLLFISEAWHREIYKESLIQDIFSMWPHGPVIPSLYHKLKYNRDKVITKYVASFMEGRYIVSSHVNKEDNQTKALLDKITETHNEYRSNQLATIILQNIPIIKESDPILPYVFSCYIDKSLGRNNVIEMNKFR